MATRSPSQHTATPQPERRRGVDWSSLFVGVLVAMVVSVPALVWAESGPVPMIDRGSDGWWFPAALVVASMVVGGACAARRQGGPLVGALYGASLGLVSAGAFVVADLLRRLMVDKALSTGVELLWVNGILAVVGAGLVGGLAMGLWRRRAAGAR
jgi:hypothetical protein